MNTTATITASVLGTGGAVVVGCCVGGVFDGNKESVVEQASTDIPWSPLTSDADFSSTYSNNTVGKEYGRYLVGMNESNQRWWEQSFKRYEREKNNSSLLHDMFSDGKVKPAYSSTDSKALNKICGEAYKKTLTSGEDFFATGSEDKHKLAANILKYCSPLGQVPITIPENDSTYTEENMIGKQGHVKKLVKTVGTDNDEFWKAQNKWFEGKGGNSSSLDTYFSKFFTGTNEAKQLSEGQTIKKICEETYKKTAATDGNATIDKPKIDDVAKYCSFSKETVN